jgi:hypothetical protein
VVGLSINVFPSEEPQTPLTGSRSTAQQFIVPPLFNPEHVHVQVSFTFATEDAEPMAQRFVVGLSINVFPSEEPQTPLTGSRSTAQQFVVPPLFNPEHVHVHIEPFFVTAEAFPEPQRLLVGASTKEPP